MLHDGKTRDSEENRSQRVLAAATLADTPIMRLSRATIAVNVPKVTSALFMRETP